MGRGTEYLEDIISYARKNEYTAIYGAGKVATGLYKDLSEAGINVACFIVTSDTGQPAEIRETTGGVYKRTGFSDRQGTASDGDGDCNRRVARKNSRYKEQAGGIRRIELRYTEPGLYRHDTGRI